MPDAFLASVIDYLPGPEYTVIYTTSPVSSSHQPVAAEPEIYEMDMNFGAPVHMELRRDLSSHRRDSSNITLPNAPLFERYSFFSPGKPLWLLITSMEAYLDTKLTDAPRHIHGPFGVDCTL